ncbi:MAG: hypothetical protein FJ267_06630 [Planctomycetes bacterium]|nr:hypothetical protein [Planctomycetota bacterium]
MLRRFNQSIHVFFVTILLSSVTSGDETNAVSGPLKPEQREAIQVKFERVLVETTESIEKDGRDLKLYSNRGDAHFFLGHFSEAVADYDKMTEIEPDLDTSHWRRGIALFYAKRFEDAAGQFERYHSFDQVDRENGIWRYLSQHRAYGQKKAREGLLMYEKDDREPFPSVYKLFAGEMTPREIFDAIDRAKLTSDEREKRLFYAHLYVGLNFSVEGDNENARKHLALSTKNTWGPKAGYGPNYMWHVGRLHEELLRTKDEDVQK